MGKRGKANHRRQHIRAVRAGRASSPTLDGTTSDAPKGTTPTIEVGASPVERAQAALRSLSLERKNDLESSFSDTVAHLGAKSTQAADRAPDAALDVPLLRRR